MSYKIKTIGILGGGPLGRMAAIAAARLGVRVCLYTPEQDSTASQLTPFTFIGAYHNQTLLREFAACVDVITYDDDNIPLETIRYLQKFKPVYPDDRVIEIAQDRILTQKFLEEIGIPTLRWHAISRPKDILKAMEDMGLEQALLKTTTATGDGAGQMLFHKDNDPKTAWKTLNANTLILEEKIAFTSEISVIIARDLLGQTAFYGPILNERHNNILSKSSIPAPLPPQLQQKATALTQFLSEAIDLVGVLCLEFYVTPGGELLAHKITPHPHNSGHWTIDACFCSQFEQQIRTICGIQVGSPSRHGDAVILNLMGDDIQKLPLYLEMPNAITHLYSQAIAGKHTRIGHVTIINSPPKPPSNTMPETTRTQH